MQSHARIDGNPGPGCRLEMSMSVSSRRDDRADVSIHLGSILGAIYDESAYELSVDYSKPPPKPVSTAF